MATTPAEDVVVGTYLSEEGCEVEVARELGLLELFPVAAEVVGRHVCDALGGHLTGEQAGLHWGVVDDTDSLLLAKRQYLGLDRAVDHGVGRLEGGNRSDLLGALHLGDGEVGCADPADFALTLEFGHRSPALFDLFVGDGPVNLIQVNDVDLEATQAGFDFSADGFEGLVDLAVFVPEHAALSEDVRFGGDAFHGPGDNFFGVTEAVYGGGVDPIDAIFDSAVDRGDRFVVFLGTPPVLPVAAADGPGAEADGGEVEVGVAKLFSLHSRLDAARGWGGFLYFGFDFGSFDNIVAGA